MSDATVFDSRSKFVTITDAQFQARQRERAPHVEESKGSSMRRPDDGVACRVRPIDWNITPRKDKTGQKVFGDNYQVAFQCFEPAKHKSGPEDWFQTVYTFDCPRPRDNEDPNKSKFRSGIANMRKLLGAITPPLKDGSDATANEKNWVPDVKWVQSNGKSGNPGILESMCAAGRDGSILLQATPRVHERPYQKKDANGKLMVDSEGKPVMDVFREYYLDDIIEINEDGTPIGAPEEAPADDGPPALDDGDEQAPDDGSDGEAEAPVVAPRRGRK